MNVCTRIRPSTSYFVSLLKNVIFSISNAISCIFLFAVLGPKFPEQPPVADVGVDRPLLHSISVNCSHIRTGNMEVSTT